MNWIEAEGLEQKDQSVQAQLEHVDGILVPGGFGKRGIEGMLKGIQYARENKVPFFGICLGMQTACIEFARNVCGLEQANSSEFDPATPHRVIYKLRELRGVEELGGTMRLGAWTCKLEPETLGPCQPMARARSASAIAIATNSIANTRGTLTAAGLRISGATPDGTYVEIVEIRRPPVLPRLPVPSRIQIEAAGAASAVLGFRQGVIRESPVGRRQNRHEVAVEMFHRPEKVKQ